MIRGRQFTTGRSSVAVLATLGIVLAGCGSGDLARELAESAEEFAREAAEAAEQLEPTPDTAHAVEREEDTAAAVGDVAPEQVALDLASVQVGAFEITFTEAVIEPNPNEHAAAHTPYHIRLAFEAENVWSEASQPFGRLSREDIVLERGQDYIVMESADLPSVPGGRMNTGTLTFAGSPELAPDLVGLTLVVGGPRHNQVILPLDGSEATTLASVPVEVTADLHAGGRIKGAQFEIHEGWVQFVSRGQNMLLDADTALLVLSMTITGDSGNYGIHSGELILDLPDGTSVSNGQRLQQTGGVPLEQNVVFPISQPTDGQYTLTIREEADVTFEVTS